MPATNTISVQVNVGKTGTYVVYTDTMNGFFFRGTGNFTTLGANNVTLRSNSGTPFAQGPTNFVVHFDTTFCDIQVTVLPAGSGPARFTLAGAPGSCSSANVAGAYAVGVPLAASNRVTLNVNVTTAGTYNVTAGPFQGMTFTGTGSLAMGVQTIVLIGTPASIPTTAGANTVSVTAGGTTCSFVVNVVGPATGTLNCGSATFTGLFMEGVVLTTSNTVQQISVNVLTTGGYNITTDTMNGVWFNAVGTFAAIGPTNITLTSNGTPANSGPFLFTVKFGASTCTFTCTFVPMDYFPRTTNSNWSYEWDNVATDSLLKFVIAATNVAGGNNYNIFMETDGTAPPGGDSSGYFRKNSGDYFEYFDLASIGLDNTDWVEYTFLKDNVAAGTSWTSSAYTNSLGGIPITFRFKDSIQQKNVPITVNLSSGPVTYQNVIVVVERINVFIGGFWVDATSFYGYSKSYYARGVGLIRVDIFNQPGTNPTPTSIQGLRRYQVF